MESTNKPFSGGEGMRISKITEVTFKVEAC